MATLLGGLGVAVDLAAPVVGVGLSLGATVIGGVSVALPVPSVPGGGLPVITPVLGAVTGVAGGLVGGGLPVVGGGLGQMDLGGTHVIYPLAANT